MITAIARACGQLEAKGDEGRSRGERTVQSGAGVGRRAASTVPLKEAVGKISRTARKPSPRRFIIKHRRLLQSIAISRAGKTMLRCSMNVKTQGSTDHFECNHLVNLFIKQSVNVVA
jgi:hypothetical protein